MRLLLQFVEQRLHRSPERLALSDLDAPLILEFLVHFGRKSVADIRNGVGGRCVVLQRSSFHTRNSRRNPVNMPATLTYFTLRRHPGSPYLGLLQFFVNHRRFLRSRRFERKGRIPCELMTGQDHSHWLTLLGLGPLQFQQP
ncbi:hypothetical protein [Paraburkholderia ultramafica]|uniref:hypothetical protein n=1 Tax=Paraburkholderia ultramafica TaxID=1544867 RepID=UPI0015818BBA|nr:hypothetical protein [Paraburkholderia ultramafica]